MIDVAPSTIVVWSDIACPWATCAVARLHRYRAKLGLDTAVRFDHRAFPLEVANRRATPKNVLDAEVPAVGAIEPEFGWQVWQARDWEWPVTSVPALEAVQAAKDQGLAASEALDLALRRAMYAESRCISLRSVIQEVAEKCDGLDVEQLTDALDHGTARHLVVQHLHTAEAEGVRGSPHLFLPDGSDAHNPGITMHWEGEHGSGFPVVDADDPSVYEDLLRRASG